MLLAIAAHNIFSKPEMRYRKLPILLIALFFVPATCIRAQSVDTYQPKTILRRSMPPITRVPFVAAEKSRLRDSELVIGVTVNEQSRAYPVNQLTGPKREIINDTVGETPIAATW